MIQTALENGKYEVIGLLKSGRAKQAARLAKTLVTKSPKDPSLRFLSGLVCLSQDNKTMAAKHFSNAIKLGSKDVAAFTNLATLQMSMKASKAADKTLALAVKTFGDDNFQVLHLMAMLRMEEGQTADALELAEKCIGLEGTRVEAWVLKGRILRSQGHLFDAIESFQTAMSLDPDNIDSLVNLSWLFAFTNQNEEALRISEDAVKRLPNSMDLRAQLAQRYTEAGRFDDAIEMYHSLCDTPEYRPMALRVLAQISPEGALPDLIARATKAVRTTKDPEALGQLHLAMHTAHQRSAASGAKKLSLGTANGFLARARPYSSQDDEVYHAAIKAAYDAEMDVSAKQNDTGAPVPIFIVGMIRSGTTLLERMLSGHDEIGPLGEVSVVGRAIDMAIHEGQDLKPTIAGLAKRYEPYQNVAGDVRFTTDKMPNNYLYIGFLRQAFPDCKIILVKRDFRDIAVSAFETYFDSPALNFSYTEAGILNRLKLFENMTSYWEAMGDICTVWYEDLVSEPERVLQSVADYCGFELQPEMTQPQRSTTAIRTASHSQARQPLYGSSQKRWQDDVCAQYLPSIVNDADNSSIAWRVAWLNDMQRRGLA